MERREPTAEQKGLAAERRERFRPLAKMVSAMPPGARRFVIGTVFDISQTTTSAGKDVDGEPWDYTRMRAAVAYAREHPGGGRSRSGIGRTRATRRSASRYATGR